VYTRAPVRPVTRQERKRRTRETLLAAALELLEEQSFSSLSLRQVTRAAGIVPTAFYRHFDSMEELGLVLIDESFRTLRAMIRAASSDPRTEHVIRNSVDILVRYVHEHDAHFRFIARERFGGVATLRHAIRSEIRLFASELATALSRFPPYLNRWPTEDLQLLSGLIVNAMVSTAEAILDAPAEDRKAEAEIVATVERQLRMIILGVPQWRSSRPRALPRAAG
jgi:AcrR family transcriptional regulator